MALIDIKNELIPTDEIVRIRTALERIATCLERATELPEQPAYPEKPIGPAAIGSYAQAVVSEEDANIVRGALHNAGFTDSEIEERLVSLLADAGEEPTE